MADRLGPNDTQPHGSPAARQRHLAHGEELCWECRQPSADLVVVCEGRRVDDRLRPVGDRCTARYRPPGLVPPEGGWVVAEPLAIAESWRAPSAAEVAERARAAGWALPDGQDPVDGGALVATCPRCRRPAPEVADLVREVRRRGR